MANNRMFLIHKPTKIGIMLGKRMAFGWYSAPEQGELERFYNFLEKNMEGSQDDFILAMEDCENSSCFNDWSYTNEKIEGFLKFHLKD